MLNDAEVVKNADRFVRLIIRRPQAYEFSQRFGESDKQITMPGIAFLDWQGRLLGTAELEGEGAAKKLVEKMKEIGR